MKTVALVLFMMMGNASWALADDLAIADTVPVVKTTLTGVIKSVSWVDPSKGTKSEIVVKDAAGKTSHILVTSTTTLWDADAKAIMQDKIMANNKVNVIYITTSEGINVGESIKILK